MIAVKAPTMLDAVLAGPVVPVVRVERAQDAVPVARALLDGGVTVIELTLRTPAALEAIRLVAAEVPEITVGAGTVTSDIQVERAIDAGAEFLVSPGFTESLLETFLGAPVPALPGVATVGEAMRAAERGLDRLKLFPAGASGGIALLRGLGEVLPGIAFCPTGGITAQSAPDYLALANVACVGGSWLTPASAIEQRDWAAIRSLAGAASALAG